MNGSSHNKKDKESLTNCKHFKNLERRYKNILESMTDIYFLVRADTTILDYKANPELLYVSSNKLVGRKTTDLLPSSIAKKSKDAIDHTLKTKEPTTVEYYLETQQDQIKTHYFEARHFYFDSNKVVIFIRDITKRKKTELKLKTINEELKQYTSNMEHDIRNSLFLIHAYMHQLLENSTLSMEEKQTFEDNISEQLKIIQDILGHSLSLAETGKYVDKSNLVNLQNTIIKACKISLAHPKNCNICDEIEDYVIKADQYKLLQLFKNIIENAMLHGKASKIEFCCQKTAQDLILSISNDGDLIPKEMRPKILSRQTKGSGLKIIDCITKGHNWDLDIVFQPRTTFNIIIPTHDIVNP